MKRLERLKSKILLSKMKTLLIEERRRGYYRDEMNVKEFIPLDYSKEVLEQVEIHNKYEGYINKALKDAEKMVDLDEKLIPDDIDYDKIHNLASEAKQKLKEIRPTSIGQALRISGVNPADISLIMIYLKKEYLYDSK